MRDERERLLDMLEAIHKIEQYVNAESGAKGFNADELVQVWVLHHLQIIGEAASGISTEFREKHPEIAWGGMIGMRQVLVHGYFETDAAIVWKVVEHDLPPLKAHLQAILDNL